MIRRLVPPAVKRLLVPPWNRAHQLGWSLRDRGSAILRRDFERCPVCGRLSLMLYRRRVIPPRLASLWNLSPRLTIALARKESSDCSSCGAKLRARRLARVLLALYPKQNGRCADSIVEWVTDPAVRALDVAEINRVDGLHNALAVLPSLAFSDYEPEATPGSIAQGVRSEDLTRLTYDDGQFDLIVTSESLEHVPDLEKALNEIKRVLKPGGRHVFTIPLLPGVASTFARSIVLDDGSIEHRATPIRHPGGDVGYPVFTEFGADFPEILRRAGYEVEIAFGPVTEEDLAQVYIARKPC